MTVTGGEAEEATESKGGHFTELKWFSIAKITFLWEGLKFKRGHGPLGSPISASYDDSAYISEVSEHVYASLAVLHLHSFATATHHVCYVSVIVCNVAASKCRHYHSIIYCCDYAILLLLHVAASVCMCLLLYAMLLLANVSTAIVWNAAVTMQCCCCYMLLPVWVNVCMCLYQTHW